MRHSATIFACTLFTACAAAQIASTPAVSSPNGHAPPALAALGRIRPVELADVVFETTLRHPAGAASWIGRVPSDAASLVVITQVGEALSGSIWRRDGAFGLAAAITPDGRIENLAITRRAASEVLSCGNGLGVAAPTRAHAPDAPIAVPPAALPGRGGSPRGDCACSESAARIDVLCVYTPAAVAAAGGLEALQARVQNGLDSTTAVIANSGAGATVMHLAAFVEVAYDEAAPTWGDHLIRVADPSDGILDDVHDLRNQFAADLVALFVDDPRFTGGQAYYAPFWPESAFSVNNWRAAGEGSLTLAHEFGHNFGCAHDRENADAGVFHFGFGHHFDFGGEELGSVMSLVGETVPYFSTPLLLYMDGPPLGVPFSEPFPTANALVVERARWAVANFRDGPAVADCNGNGIDDAADIAGGTSLDLNGDCRPDECEIRVYVDGSAAPGGDGSSWARAAKDLDTALELARIPCSNVSEVWIADGIYVPGRGAGDPAARFTLRSGLRIYGGFQGQSHPTGGETTLAERNPIIQMTVLSGEIGDPDALFDNCTTVIEAVDVDAFALLDGLTIERGYSGSGGGAGLVCVRASPKIRNCRFRDHFAAGAGGALLLLEGSNPVIESCHFEGNATYQSGGAIAALDGSSPTLRTTVLVSNTAGWGGAIAATADSSLELVGCNFAFNSAAQIAGAVDLAAGAGAVVSNCAFIGNSAGDSAGAVSVGSGAVAEFGDCAFIGNSAAYVGGAVASFGGGVVIQDGEFRMNQADYGGALAVLSAAEVEVSRTTFNDNMVSLGGGACEVWGAALDLTDCDFIANSASAGDGGACRVNAGSLMNFVRCRFDDNAALAGGAVQIWDSDVRIVGGEFARNIAVADGGAIAVAAGPESAAAVAVDGAVFRLNRASTGSSGAVSVWNADATILNALFRANEAHVSGGAIGAFNGSTLALTNCTLHGSTALESGGGIVAYDSPVSLSNTILWQNVSGEAWPEDAQIRCFGTPPAIAYSCVEGWSGVLGGTANFGFDPLFVDAQAGDYRLAAGSPCIDSGSVILTPADALDRDVDGDVDESLPWDCAASARFADIPAAADSGEIDPARPELPTVDRGAFESLPTACPGDVDDDGRVDLSDLATLLGHYGTPSGALESEGDLDGDGDVDLSDLTLLLANFGTVC
ncbi:MAG: hypothetical protein AMXMBFR47_37860 [Planctomycetota bacterium]